MGTDIPMGWAVTDRSVSDNSVFNFSLILHPGDVAYAGTGAEWEFEEIWDVWCDQVEPIAAIVPYMFAVGNHEKYYNYSSFSARFKMPSQQSGGEGNFWYSIDYGNVHFTFMSTEHDYDAATPQQQWLIQDLQKANQNRKQIPWIFVLGHRPMYSSDKSEWDSHRPGAHFQQVIEPIFLKYGVDLYLCGHMHMYERVYPVEDGTVVSSGNVYKNPGATAHVNQATGGVFIDESYIDPQPAWSASRRSEWGYGRLTIHNNTYLHYEFVHQDDGNVLDEFWISKD
jgi:hypothetical protein